MARTKEEILAEWDTYDIEPPAPTTKPAPAAMSPDDVIYAANHGGWTRAEYEAMYLPGDPNPPAEPEPEAPTSAHPIDAPIPEAKRARRSRTTVDKHQRAEIVRYHNDGYPPQSIAALVGLDTAYVYSFIGQSPLCNHINRTKRCRQCDELLVLVCRNPDCDKCN